MVESINLLANFQEIFLSPSNPLSKLYIYALIGFAFFLIAELIHQRKINQVCKLAFGPAEKQRAWTYSTIIFKPIAVGILILGFGILIISKPGTSRGSKNKIPAKNYHRLVFMIDSSPSMTAKDAITRDRNTNEVVKISRSMKASSIIRDILFNSGIPLDRISVDVVPFWYKSITAVEHFTDHNAAERMCENFFLMAFDYRNKKKQYKTDIFKSLNETFDRLNLRYKQGKLAKKGATVFILTDGQTLPPQGLPQTPPCVAKVIVVGLGDPKKSTNIANGISTKQDISSLKNLASRLRGFYYNANENTISSDDANFIVTSNMPEESTNKGAIYWAKILILISASYLCTLPILLHFFGAGWKSIYHRTKAVKQGDK